MLLLPKSIETYIYGNLGNIFIEQINSEGEVMQICVTTQQFLEICGNKAKIIAESEDLESEE